MNPPGARAKRQQVDRASRAISRDRTRIKLEVVALSKADHAANRLEGRRRQQARLELLLAATIALSKAQYRHNRRRIRGLRLRYHMYPSSCVLCYCVRCSRRRATRERS